MSFSVYVLFDISFGVVKTFLVNVFLRPIYINFRGIHNGRGRADDTKISI